MTHDITLHLPAEYAEEVFLALRARQRASNLESERLCAEVVRAMLNPCVAELPEAEPVPGKVLDHTGMGKVPNASDG